MRQSALHPILLIGLSLLLPTVILAGRIMVARRFHAGGGGYGGARGYYRGAA
jgi:hypothetical protein